MGIQESIDLSVALAISQRGAEEEAETIPVSEEQDPLLSELHPPPSLSLLPEKGSR